MASVRLEANAVATEGQWFAMRFAFALITSLMMRKPSHSRANPRLKMIWWVPLTHNVMWGLRTCLPELPNVPSEVMPEAPSSE